MINQESLAINNRNKGVVVAAFMEGVSSPYCLMTLGRIAPKTISELLEEVNKQIGMEETLKGRNIYGMSPLLPLSKRLGEHNSTYDQEKRSKKNKKENDKAGNVEDRSYQQFTPLTLPLGEFFAQMD